jgi:beta-1,4-mannosyl-glycoprotein beta-1,4-N-acetylglucosaminyltransferase
MIIDCFLFYTECDMLEYRLEILYQYVNYFVIVESNKTFAGNEKKLYYKQNSKRFEKYKNKIFYIIVDNTPETINSLSKEIYQRNCIKKGLERIDCKDDDLIIISDLDEIPDIKTIKEYENYIKNVHMVCLEQEHYYYSLNYNKIKKWYFARVITYSLFKNFSYLSQNVRVSQCNILQKGGWHLSYFGNPEFIKNKLEQFSHQEFNNENYTDIFKIKYKIENGINLFDNVKFKYVLLKDNEYLPPNMELFLSFFQSN